MNADGFDHDAEAQEVLEQYNGEFEDVPFDVDDAMEVIVPAMDITHDIPPVVTAPHSDPRTRQASRAVSLSGRRPR